MAIEDLRRSNRLPQALVESQARANRPQVCSSSSSLLESYCTRDSIVEQYISFKSTLSLSWTFYCFSVCSVTRI